MPKYIKLWFRMGRFIKTEIGRILLIPIKILIDFHVYIYIFIKMNKSIQCKLKKNVNREITME